MTYNLLIDGNSVQTDESFEVINPSTEEVVGHCPTASPVQVDRAVAAAQRAFTEWSVQDDQFRADTLHKLANIIEANAEELAQLLTQEQGKTLNGIGGSRFELGG